MTQLLNILAQQPVLDRLEGLRHGFNTKQTIGADFRGFLWFAVGVALVLLILIFWNQWRQRRALNAVGTHPMRLFARGLKVLGIGIVDRLVLEVVARRCGVPHPAAMLVSPTLLESHAGQWADGLTPTAVSRFVRSRVDVLRDAAFADRKAV